MSGLFPVWGSEEQTCHKHSFTYRFCVNVLLYFSGISANSASRGSSKKLPIYFHSGCTTETCTLVPTVSKTSVHRTLCRLTVATLFFWAFRWVDSSISFIMVLSLYVSLVADGLEHHRMCLFAICKSCFVKYLFMFLAHSLVRSFVTFL